MKNIATKTLGMLIDELITTRIKINVIGPKNELKQREADIQEYIEAHYSDIIAWSIQPIVDYFITVNAKCFEAQEVVMKEIDPDTVAEAAKSAQKWNAARNSCIRTIDTVAGEIDFSPTTKTYHKSGRVK